MADHVGSTLAFRYCREFVDRLTYSGLGNWLRALLPADSFAGKADEVQNQIVEIRRTCEELLNRNVADIKQSNKRGFDHLLPEL